MSAREFATIGKETNRRWGRDDDIGLLESDVIQYRANETGKLITDNELQRALNASRIEERRLASTAGISREVIPKNDVFAAPTVCDSLIIGVQLRLRDLFLGDQTHQ